jgi:nitroreductase
MKRIFLSLILLTIALATSIPMNAQENTDNIVINTIMERRSIRDYHTTPVSRDTLMQIMTCGIHAANGQNKQSWEVRVVDNPATLNHIQELMAIGNLNMDANMIKGCMRGAPVMVFIARDINYDFSAYDCGLLAGNILLSAQSMSVGSICLGSPVRFINDAENSAEILRILGYSENYELCLCVGLGYAAEAPDAKPRDINKVQFVD